MRISTTAAGLALAASVWLSPAGAQDAAAPGETVAAPAQPVAVAPLNDDAAIARRITEILEATGWYRDPRVAVAYGVVFLDGTTDTAEHRAWARDLAAKTQDVVAVVNRLAVDPRVEWSFRPAVTEIVSLMRTSAAALPLVLFALVVLPLAWIAAGLVARVVRRLLGGRTGSPFLGEVIARTVAVPVFLLGLYVVLQVAGLTQLALSVIGGAGMIGIIVGFAFRDIAENFLASLLLSVRQPFRRGDFISVEGREGTVQSMNTRSTLILSVEGNHIQIPNAVVFKSTIVNYSAAPARRETVDVGIGYEASIATAQDVIRSVLAGHEAVMSEPEGPLVLVDSLGAATVNLRAYFWFDGRVYAAPKVRSALLRLIKRALIETGISMPDEAREIIFPQGVPLVGPAGAIAPAPPAPVAAAGPAAEPDSAATSSEGDLGNAMEEVERQASVAVIPEASADLLGAGSRAGDRGDREPAARG